MREAACADQTVDTAYPVLGANASQDQLAAAAREIENLQIALESARIIGAAIGIVMAMQKITYDAAFEMLSAASQHQNRKLRDVADEVVDYGVVLGK